MGRNDRAEERELAVADVQWRKRERESYKQGAQAALPQQADESGLVSLSGGKGDLPEHEHDRFARYDGMVSFLASCEKPAHDVMINEADGTERELSSHEKAYRAQGVKYTNKDHAKALLAGPHIDPAWEGMTGEPLAFDGLKRFFLQGWPEGAALIREAIAKVEPPPAMDIRRKGVWADSGDALSTDRLQAGAYESAWRTTKKRLSFALQRVRIVVDIGSTCAACGTVGHNARYLSASSLFWRGAAASALCDSLENAGYRVEIVTACAFGNSALKYPDQTAPSTPAMHRFEADDLTMGWIRNGKYASPTANTSAIGVVVKDFDAPLDISTVAAGTASAAMYRRAMFLSHVANAHRTEQVASCFGALLSVEQSPRIRRELGLDEEGVATLFVSQWTLTQKLANAWARGALYGIESHRTGYTEEDMQLEGGPA